MMGLLSAALQALFGRFLTTLTVPALILGALTLGKMAWDKRDARLIAHGEMICQADWEAKARAEEQQAAAVAIAAVRAELTAERRSAEELRDDVQRISAEYDTLRVEADAADARCLSDGVLNALRRSQPAGSKAKSKAARHK